MKRSEMIKIMEDNKNLDMNELLSLLEQMGMLPPRNPNITFEQQLRYNGLNCWEYE